MFDNTIHGRSTFCGALLQKQKTEEEVERRERELVAEQQRLAEEKVRREEDAKRRKIAVSGSRNQLLYFSRSNWLSVFSGFCCKY